MSPRPKARNLAFVEQLEDRTLFSTISVVSFGATPSDGGDDSFPIQEAINSSKAGDTIFFPAGTYNINNQLDAIPSNRTLTSNGDATLVGARPTGELLDVHSGNNITISNLTFNGGGVFLDSQSGLNSGIVLNNNVFNMNSHGSNNNAITFTSGLQNSSITNNLFTGYDGGFGIYGYNYQGLTIANNEFVNLSAGMHIDAQTASDGNLLVEQNYITGAQGMGMEFQGSATNLTFQDNWYENPNLSTNFAANTSSMAFSLILDKSANILIQRNTVIAPQKPDGTGTRIAFEVGGDNTMVRENYINGVNATIAMNDGSGSASVTAENNLMMSYAIGPQIAFPSSIRTLTLINNGPGVQLDWDINRGRPGRNIRFGGVPISGPGTGTITPTPSPTDPSLIAPTNLVATAMSANRVDLTWQDNATGETGYEIERSIDGGKSWVQIAIVGYNTTSYSDVNLPPNTAVTYRVRAYSPAGQGDYSNTANATTLSGSSTGTSTGASGGGTPTGTGTGTSTGTTAPSGGGTVVMIPTPPSGGVTTRTTL